MHMGASLFFRSGVQMLFNAFRRDFRCLGNSYCTQIAPRPLGYNKSCPAMISVRGTCITRPVDSSWPVTQQGWKSRGVELEAQKKMIKMMGGRLSAAPQSPCSVWVNWRLPQISFWASRPSPLDRFPPLSNYTTLPSLKLTRNQKQKVHYLNNFP